MAITQTPDTRERILRATLRLIGEHGIAAVTNRGVASAAGVALGSLTYHFPDQSDLLRESMLLYVAEEVERVNAVAVELRGRDVTIADVATEVERVVERTAGAPEQIAELELHLQASRDPALRDAAMRCFAAYEQLAAAALGAFDIEDADRYAPAVVALMHGLALRRLASGDPHATGTADALLLLVRGASAPH